MVLVIFIVAVVWLLLLGVAVVLSIAARRLDDEIASPAEPTLEHRDDLPFAS